MHAKKTIYLNEGFKITLERAGSLFRATASGVLVGLSMRDSLASRLELADKLESAATQLRSRDDGDV